jgi:6-phosphogluconate dehydrogenase
MEKDIPFIFNDLNKFKESLPGKLSKKQFKLKIMQLLNLWREKSIFEERLLQGLECTFKLKKEKYYSLNLRDGFFEPKSSKEENQIMRQIVLPELK